MGTNFGGGGDTWEPPVWYYHLRQSLRRWDATPMHITGIYLVFGFLALYFSDVLLVQLIEDPARLSQLQAVKGGVEVVVTGGLIFVLVRRSRHALGRTNDRLEQRQHELQVLHRVLRHNLRNDITLIIGYGTTLLDDLEDDCHRQWAETIVTVAERVNHYTDQARKINKVDATDTTTTIDLVAVVTRTLDARPELRQAASIEVSLPDAAPVRAHPVFREAVEELLRNAVEHNDSEAPTVSLTVNPDAGPPHRTELVVSDNGPGIPAHVRRTIEQRGETPLVHLDGLGLWLVSWVVSVSDGEFRIEDRDAGGTRVRIQVPTATSHPPARPAVQPLTDRPS